jgi:hypothetical protein
MVDGYAGNSIDSLIKTKTIKDVIYWHKTFPGKWATRVACDRLVDLGYEKFAKNWIASQVL